MSDRRCRCVRQGGDGCDDGHAAFWSAVQAKCDKLVAEARADYAHRNTWATGGGGRDLAPVSEDLAGIIEMIAEKRG